MSEVRAARSSLRPPLATGGVVRAVVELGADEGADRDGHADRRPRARTRDRGDDQGDGEGRTGKGGDPGDGAHCASS